MPPIAPWESRLKRVGFDAWHALAEKGSAPSDVALFKQFVAEVRAVESVERQLDFTITAATPDRERDTIEAAGWETANFLKNPVVLWAHQYDQLPVARALSLTTSGDRVLSRAEFVGPDLYAFGDTVFRMYKGGFLSAVSVGFNPKKWNYNEDRRGVDFLNQELLEYSCVPVPAHPEALIAARSAGVDVTQITAWAQTILDGGTRDGDVVIARDQVEAIFKALGGKKVFAALIDVEAKAKPECPRGASCANADNSAACPADDCPMQAAATTASARDLRTKSRTALSKIALRRAKSVAAPDGAFETIEASLDVVGDVLDDVIAKRGRVLAKRNEDRLREAHEKIDAVLSELDKAPVVEDDGTVVVEESVGGPLVKLTDVYDDFFVRIADDEDDDAAPMVKIADGAFDAALRAFLKDQIAALAADNIGEAIRRHTGRLD